MTTTWINYKQLRGGLSFQDILAHYNVTLRAKGDQWHGFCPLPTHEGTGRSPSFSANIAKGIWHCFGCGGKGNALEFIARMEGYNPDDKAEFRKAALFAQETFTVGENNPPPERKALPEQQAKEEEPPPPEMPVIVNAPLDFELKSIDYEHPYLRDRGFSNDTIKALGLGYCSRGLMKGRIAIPLHDADGALIGYAGRIVDDPLIGKDTPRYLFPASRERNGTRHEFHKSAFLYNGFRVWPTSDIVVVEGFPAVWWLTQAGIANVVALMGASCSEAQATLIRNLIPEDGRVWILPDGDQAGEHMAESAMKLLAPHRFVRWVKIGEGKQPTDMSAEDLNKLLPVV